VSALPRIPPQRKLPSSNARASLGPLDRLGGLLPFAAFYFLVEIVLRAALFARSAGELSSSLSLDVRVFAIGFVFDAVVLLHLLLPAAMYRLLASDRWLQRPAHRVLAATFTALGAFAVLFDATAEWLFWEEFESRFNFIAVDYLVYTREVIANIVESYPVFPLLVAIGVAAGAVAWGMQRSRSPAPQQHAPLWARLVAATAGVAASLLAFLWIGPPSAKLSAERLANELAMNGMYSFCSAFRANAIDYEQFYQTRESGELFAHARALLAEPGASFRDAGASDLARIIRPKSAEQRPNVILVAVESLSADYLGTFGGGKQLTPNLDRLARESLFFTRIYATGNRTVRGIEALTLSLPPTPGSSIVKRPDHQNLFSVGFLFRERGYATHFLYGGYGYFDNMNAFFGSNGFDVMDRASLTSGDVTFANAWGVADEDLFRRVLRQADADFAVGRRFFSFALTTSNHRPFTYPAYRIDIPSGAGRDGGVKYTDWAIGQFLREAHSHPWFRDTVFVIVADHCSGTSGRIDLELSRYHIPLFVYAPGRVAAARVDTLASQMDVAPTLLALLGWSYTSKFYGRDILAMRPEEGRALPATYERLGFWRGGTLVTLGPNREIGWVQPEADGKSRVVPRPANGDELLSDAIAFYETASARHRLGLDRWERRSASTARTTLNR
jgi:phosphoglycerol transferase MdoB-like AlkP superfamily enzyme